MNDFCTSPINIVIIAILFVLLPIITGYNFQIGRLRLFNLSKQQNSFVEITGVAIVFIVIAILLLNCATQQLYSKSIITSEEQNVNHQLISEKDYTLESSQTLIQTPYEKIDVKCQSDTKDPLEYATSKTLEEAYKKITIQDTLQTSDNKPTTLNMDKTMFNLCLNIENKLPLGTLHSQHPRISIDSLPRNNRGRPFITCYSNLFGTSTNIDNHKDTLLYFWEDVSSQLTFPIYKQPILIHSRGYATWATKKVWKGNWQLTITTSSGKELKTISFVVY